MFISKLSPEQWAEARRMRADGASYAAIGRHVGITAAAISRRAHKDGWPMPAGDTSKRVSRARPSRASPGTAGIRSRLAERLYRVIEFRIRMMELRMIRQLRAQEGDHQGDHQGDRQSDPGGAPPLPAKDERESFAALIESINQVTEMAAELAPAADGRRGAARRAANPELTALSDDIDADGLAVASEKDEFRRELAEHLGKMFPKP